MNGLNTAHLSQVHVVVLQVMAIPNVYLLRANARLYCIATVLVTLLLGTDSKSSTRDTMES